MKLMKKPIKNVKKAIKKRPKAFGGISPRMQAAICTTEKKGQDKRKAPLK